MCVSTENLRVNFCLYCLGIRVETVFLMEDILLLITNCSLLCVLKFKVFYSISFSMIYLAEI